ncbi:hypothetical protein D3C75_752190 [compost metagenome]
MAIFLYDVGWGNQGDGTRRSGGAQPRTHLAFGIRFQQIAVHIAGAAAHDVTRHDVFCHGGLHKAGGGINLHFARLDIGLIDYTSHTTIMVYVAMSVDNSDNGLFTSIFIIEIHTHFGGLCRNQRVNHGNAFFPLNDGHIGEIQVTDLVNTIRDLKQAADVNQLRLAPQAWVHGIRRFFAFLDEGILLGIPDDIAFFTFDNFGGQGSYETFMCVGKIGVI